ncbi:glycoside hydrolase family 3 N-terminal domain-containing protein [Pseudanabaena sp. PCC 6802]|uniref:glycoside hydrolase family 3 N-terminal domain-containing protein n=1 Tax=Pseudanabaena sp. PCC 6802 TaxID=118173 RepID=UPI00034CF531|nr:glycoside hydrolase family 3 N-terminal domain-containing protein [Pseudanabaena sp. PCC 6802]
MITLPNIDSLSLQEQVAQMIAIRASGYLYDHQIQYPNWEPPNQTLQTWISRYGVGGVILMGGSAPEVYLRSQQLHSWAGIPLLIAADVEEGVGQRFEGATCFPPPMALSNLASPHTAINMAERMGAVTAQEAKAIGLNWLMAPVVDVNNNPANPVINVRSFAENSMEVSRLGSAFIRGAKSHAVLTTAKHFPGHGDTAIDSHLQTPTIDCDRERFTNVELPPFASAIAAGVDAVMTAHVYAPVLDAQYIATLSPKIVTDLLRQEMRFDGLIVTDALVMAGIADRYTVEQVAVQAVMAGADILLMPVDPVATIEAICAAVEAGKISRYRIKASLERIWKAKTRVCGEQPALDELYTNLGSEENLQASQEITVNSLRIHKPPSLAPLRDRQAIDLLIVDDQLTCTEFLSPRSAAVAVPSQLGYPHLILDRYTLPYVKLEGYPHVLLQIFSRGNPFRGSVDLHEQIGKLITELVEQDKLAAIAVYGSPYNLDRIIPLLPPGIPWTFSYSQLPAAQLAVMQALGLAAV